MNNTNHNIPSHIHTSKWTTVYLIKLNIDTYMQFFTACFYHEYWICHTHTLKWQWKVSGIGCCSIKHLIMMSDTVVLLLSTIERRMFFDIYSHKWEKIVKYHLHLQIVHAYRSKIVNYSYLFLFNCSTDGCLVLLNRRREYITFLYISFVMYFEFATLVFIWKNDSICIF
jgi:hypothetical protein